MAESHYDSAESRVTNSRRIARPWGGAENDAGLAAFRSWIVSAYGKITSAIGEIISEAGEIISEAGETISEVGEMVPGAGKMKIDAGETLFWPAR